MKKYFFFLCSAIAALLMTSCSEEDIFNGQAGDVVTFNVSIPELATRAAGEYEQKTGDGFYATSLYYGVYEKNGDSYELKPDISAIVKSKAIEGEGGKFNVQVRLVKQKPYRIVFWAENKDNNMCAIDWGKQTLNLNPSLSANQEAYDAFWVYKDVTIQGATEEIVELKRPFAQLNIGVSNDDWKAAVAAGIEIENSQVVVSNVPTTMNIINGTVDAEKEVTYTAAALPKTYNNEEFTFPVDGNKYLALNYVLVGETKSLINIGLNYMDEGASGSYSTSFTSVPVQRNYRTNIYGNILTSDADYNVEIKPGFDGEVNSEDMLKDALTNGGKFTLLSDMTWPEGFAIPEGKNVEIDLNDNTLTIDTENEVKGNLSINNGNVVVDIEEDGDLLPAFTAYNGATVDLNNANINLAGKNALVVVANSEVAATINVNKTTITGASGSVTHGISMPFGAKDIKINITESTLTGDYALYLYATNSVVTIDDKSLVKDFWIMGGKVDIAYTGTKPEVKMDGLAAEVNFYSQNEYPLHAAIAKGGEITLTEDVVLTQPIALAAGVEATLNLNGKTISGNWSKDNGAVIKNDGSLKMIGGTVKSTADNGGSALQNNGTAILEGTTLNGAPNANGGWPSYTVNNIGTLTLKNSTITSYHGAVASYGDNAVVTLNDCVIDMTGIAGFTSHGIYTYNNGKVIVNGGTYENKATDQASSGASVINGHVEVNAGTFNGRIENYYGTPVLKGGTYSVKPNEKFVAAGFRVLEKAGKWYVVPAEVTAVADSEAEIRTALKVANEVVYVYPTEDGSSYKLEGKLSLAEGVKLIGAGDEPVALFNDWGSNAFGNQAHFTNTHIENVYFSNNLIIDAGIANGNVTFKGCVFGGDLAHQGVHFDSGNGTITFDDCTFVGRNMFGSSLENVIFNNCKFENKKSSQTGADKWTGVNMWGKYEFNNCEFDTEATCNVKCDGVIADFNNCFYSNGKDIKEVISNSPAYTCTIKFDGK